MLYGVFSDIHSNLEALNAVLDAFESAKVEGYICAGDLVGYGPEPNAVLERIRELKNCQVICGNHDLAVIGRLDVEWFNAYARSAALWTRNVLTSDSRAYLESLTAKLDAKDFTLAHGTPRKPAEEYLMTAHTFRENISRVHVWPLIVGHSHMPHCFRINVEGQVEDIDLLDHQVVEMGRAAYGTMPIVFNPGSVGQPRDHDPRASCALFDSGKGTWRSLRLSYDIAAVQAKMRSNGLPEYLALRLAYGQ
ncbi:MAG: metallophosphoesterase family protein [Elusimicrobiota bacterium]